MTLHQEWEEIIAQYIIIDVKDPVYIREAKVEARKTLISALVKSLKAKMPASKKYGTNLEGYEDNSTQKFIKEKTGEITGYNTAIKEFNTILDELEKK